MGQGSVVGPRVPLVRGYRGFSDGHQPEVCGFFKELCRRWNAEILTGGPGKRPVFVSRRLSGTPSFRVGNRYHIVEDLPL